jgi:SPP1 gp7 family putative phage head morphogenesis protein
MQLPSMAPLHNLYTPGWCPHQPENTPADLTDPPSNLNDMVAMWSAQIWAGKGKAPVPLNDGIIQAYATYLGSGVKKGHSAAATGGSIKIDWDTPDAEMLESLTRNTWHFSAAKNYNQLRALTDALKDENGKLRSWNDFKSLANEINNTHVNQWLRTEYDLAVAGGQMAGKWQRITAQKATLPSLRYSTAGDERVRVSHQVLDGIVRPVDDPFWDINYPPNGFKCRCDVDQVDHSGPITPDEKLPPTEMHPMFQVNLGKQGLAFPPKHPYFDGAPVEVRETAISLYTAISPFRGQGA